MKIFVKILIMFLTINLCLFSNEIHNKSKSQVTSKIFSSDNQIIKNQIIKNRIIQKRIQQRLLKTQVRDGCEEGYVDDCSGDGDCCPESWIGDGFEDCEDPNNYGCDLTCYDNDAGDCSDDGGGDGGGDCDAIGGNEDWLGDGWCDDSNNNETCGFDNGDCCYSTCVSGVYDCEADSGPCVADICIDPNGNNDDCEDGGGDENSIVSLSIGGAIGIEGEIPGEGIQFGVEIPLFYESSESIGGIQFTISDNPDWVTGIDLMSASDCFESNSNDVNGSMIGILFSLEGCELDASDSSVHFATITYEFSTEAEWGELVDLVFSDAIVSDGSGNALSVGTSGSSVDVSILGDVSSDMEVNVIDVVNLINYILFIEEPSDYQHWAADVNSDTALNILDVVMLVDLILDR